MKTEEKAFQKKSIFVRAKMSQAELDKYYEEYRKDRYEKGLGVGGLFWRKVLHPVLLAGIKAERVIRRNSITVIDDKRRKSDKPRIYACTHIGGHDVETCFEAIKEHAFLFIGDPREAYRNFDGLLLFLNGMICLETRSKSDRKIAKENAVQFLYRGGISSFTRRAFGI